jgi:hypothetical protein
MTLCLTCVLGHSYLSLLVLPGFFLAEDACIIGRGF